MNRLCTGICAPLLVLVLACLPSLARAQCGLVAHTVVETTVHSGVPTLSTRAGWRLGDVIASLPAGSEIHVCQTRKVGQFGIGTRTWLRVQFDGGISGWAYLGATDMSAPRTAFGGFALIPQAMAGGKSAESNSADGLPWHGGGWILMLSAAFVVLGIATRQVFDRNTGLPPRQRLRIEACKRALTVGPLAMVVVLLIGDFTLNGETATLVCLLIAFQSGFFWQVLLGRRPSPLPLSRMRERGSTIFRPSKRSAVHPRHPPSRYRH
ncbi:hypothetical protein HIV01_009680 [Lysobacter arenosi]|uniref:SH3 domain-containing protein n=1 Tax=Lysobacter arenosi TaxID=2795387 RepID=A0ABX7R808_9GAMM|nr:hypothetical protein [Lysobacter arenosi]QSX73532.1 hypothetical protein HIV01_009680 [Lysobacter arenosi]